MKEIPSMNELTTDGTIPIDSLANELQKSWSGQGGDILKNSLREHGFSTSFDDSF